MVKKDYDKSGDANGVLRVALMCRVSTEEQALHGYSMTAQEESLVQYAKERGYKIVGIYRDAGFSARKPVLKRPAMLELLEDVKAGKIDRILFIKLDRWFRNVREYHRVQAILDEHNVTWQATMEDYNTASADGRLKVNIMLSVAENEADKTSERIKFVFDAKAKKKETVFRKSNCPFGYKAEQIDGVWRLIKDPETEDAVNAFIRTARDYSVYRAVEETNNEYGLHRSYPMWLRIMQSEIYTGTYKGVADFCPAYLTKEEQDDIVNPNRRLKKTQHNRIYLYSGLMHCPLCGNKLSARQCISRGREYYYYRCYKAKASKLCSYKVDIPEVVIEEYLLSNIRQELERFVTEAELQQAKPKPKKNKSSKDKLQEQLRRLNVAYVAGNMSDTEYEEATAAVKAKLSETDESTQAEKKPDVEALRALLDTDFENIYQTLNRENKRRFWRSFIQEIKVNGKEVTGIIPRA